MARNRLNFEIPAVTLRKLILWAASRGEKKSTWARTVLALRCDENYPKVQKWLEDEAGKLGVTPQDLENRILEREGFDFAQYREEMLGLGNTPEET